MKADGDVLLALVLQFALLSLLAIGGANAVVPEMQRQTVDLRHWLTEQQFGELFALSQAAPGPNVMIAALIGQQAAGPLGAILAMAAMCAPTAVLACVVAKVSDRYRETRWLIAVEAGLPPVTIGLFAATALIIARAADRSWVAVAVTAAAFAVTYWTRRNPLIALGAAAIIGLAGLL
jgi:chromate transporter